MPAVYSLVVALRWLRFALAGATARESLLVLFKGEQRRMIFEVASLKTVVRLRWIIIRIE